MEGGLLAMVAYAQKIMQIEKIEIEVIGFDSGHGMPQHQGYKDHPELYVIGDFPMQQQIKLRELLPNYCRLIILDLNVEDWTNYLNKDAPVGFISIDVDYYSSTIHLLKYIQNLNATQLLPNSLFYFDDVNMDNHNHYQGELLAISEFNTQSDLRKFCSYKNILTQKQKFYNAGWLNQIYQLHVLYHPIRSHTYRNAHDAPVILANKFLGKV